MRSALGILILSGALAAPALAQSPTIRNATIAPGKAARIAVETALKKDCSIGEIGGIRVISAPKNGEIVVRSGNLKTPGSFRCPNKDTPVQQLIYMPKKGYSGTDEVSYETRTPEGQTQTFTVKIDVSTKPASSKGIQDL